MTGKLRLTAALCRQKTEGDHFTLLIVQTGAGIVIAKTVIRQPQIDVTALLRAGLPEVPHSLTKDIHLRLRSGFPAVFRGRSRL